MEISFSSHLDMNKVNATKFCTWFDNCDIVVFANICIDLIVVKSHVNISSNLNFEQRVVTETGPNMFYVSQAPN